MGRGFLLRYASDVEHLCDRNFPGLLQFCDSYSFVSKSKTASSIFVRRYSSRYLTPKGEAVALGIKLAVSQGFVFCYVDVLSAKFFALPFSSLKRACAALTLALSAVSICSSPFNSDWTTIICDCSSAPAATIALAWLGMSTAAFSLAKRENSLASASDRF